VRAGQATGYKDAVPLLEDPLKEERNTNNKLTAMAEDGKNEAAAGQRAESETA
jgi:ferritin-like metal-binding protein YciE